MGNKVVCFVLTILLCSVIQAQDVALSTNIADYANLGTINAEAALTLARHWSVNAGFRYNPFSFKGGKGDAGLQSKQRTLSLGARYWPWHIYSGWWIAGKMQYQEYNRGGIVSMETKEGDRYGAGLSAGYTYMLSEHFNLEVGLGGWTGIDRYKTYSCPSCGRLLDEGNKYFVLLNDVLLSFSYIF